MNLTPRGRTAATPRLIVIAVLVAALSFRAPFLSVGPIAGDLADDLGLDPARIGLLTTLPVRCFGLSAPLAGALARRLGFDFALLVGLATIVAGLVVRSLGPWEGVLAGSVVIGVGITVGNIVVPAIIRRDVEPEHRPVVTSGYTGAMNVGAMAATLTIAPLAAWLGWRAALAAWATVTVCGAVLWSLVALRPRRAHAVGSDSAVRLASLLDDQAADPIGVAVPVRRTAVGWLLALAFAGQVSAYYAVAAWLPQVLQDEAGLSAARSGAVTSWFQVLALAGALLFSAATRRVSWGLITVAIGVLWLACPVVLLVAPGLHLVGATLAGLAQGAGLTALFVLIMQISETDQRAVEHSAFVQGTGYVLSAAAPFAVGALHQASDGWRSPLLLVVGYVLVFTTTQWLAVGRSERRATPSARSGGGVTTAASR